MQYDQENDNYICSYGRRLVPIGTRRRKSKSNYQAKISIYEGLDCGNCHYRDKCNKGKGNKKLYIAKTFIGQSIKSLKNITTPEGILLRMNLSIHVEGAFGILKQDYGFRIFLMRGNKNVKIEFLLLSFGYNINKLHNKRQEKKLVSNSIRSRLCSNSYIEFIGSGSDTVLLACANQLKYVFFYSDSLIDITK